uniref:GNAT family N-acetyltransferase n=1 Tax=Parasutterella excrementihominis TaxID=487175 RepID=UPI003FEFED2E
MQRIIQRSNWAPRSRNLKDWNRDFEKHISFVAIDDRTIVGFGDIEENGYLDRLFVRPDYQRMGIGTAICNKLEGAVQGNVFTHASITAKPFFEKRGYKVIKRQTVKRRGVLLTNFVMEYRR